MKYLTILMLWGIALLSFFSCGSDLAVDIPKIIEFVEAVDIPDDGTGKPGGDIKIVSGKPNVIAQYVNQSYNEFVRWEDGGVKYIVYNDIGDPAPYATVTGLPGVKDPDKEYVANADGAFIVPPEDLPENKDISLRAGSASVEYNDSNGVFDIYTSAPNVYVPNRMYVRMRLAGGLMLDGAYMIFNSIIVERNAKDKDNESNWQQIPDYLGNLTKGISAYRLTTGAGTGQYDDPERYADENGYYQLRPSLRKSYRTDITSFDISTTTNLRVSRLRKSADHFKPVKPNDDFLWDEVTIPYFTLTLDSYYGMTPNIGAVIKMAPTQIMPMLKSVNVYGPYNSGIGFFVMANGELDIDGAKISDDLFYKSSVARKPIVGKNCYLYEPEQHTAAEIATIKTVNHFIVKFVVTGNSQNSPANAVDGKFEVTTPYIGATVVLSCYSNSATTHFYPLNTIGYFEYSGFPAAPPSPLRIRKRTSAADGWAYYFPNSTLAGEIPVAYYPTIP